MYRNVLHEYEQELRRSKYNEMAADAVRISSLISLKQQYSVAPVTRAATERKQYDVCSTVELTLRVQVAQQEESARN